MVAPHRAGWTPVVGGNVVGAVIHCALVIHDDGRHARRRRCGGRPARLRYCRGRRVAEGAELRGDAGGGGACRLGFVHTRRWVGGKAQQIQVTLL